MMVNDTQKLVLLFIVAIGAGLLVTPVYIYLAHRFKFLDKPAHRKTHQKPVAFLGGIAVFTAILITLAVGFSLVFFSSLSITSLEKMGLILFCSLGVAVIGLTDDLLQMSAGQKFLGQFIFAVIFATLGFRFNVIQPPGFQTIQLYYLSIPVTVFWILTIINAVNLIDGVDGLAGTVVCGILFLIGIGSALSADPLSLCLSLVALGAVIGFLHYNWAPAKIYLGDAGSNGLGMLLACLLVSLGREANYLPIHQPLVSEPPQPFPYQFFIVTLIIIYPVLEISLSVIRRLLRGRPITKADNGHIHDRLLQLGWPKRSICLAALTTNLLAGGSALAVISHDYGKATVLLAAFVLLLGISLSFLKFLDFFHPQVIVKTRPYFQIAHHFITLQKLKLQLVDNPEETITLINQTCREFGVQEYYMVIHGDKPGDKPCVFSWDMPPHEKQEYLNYLKFNKPNPNSSLFKDHILVDGGKGEATWIFEPHTEEADLDVEYRILISEFMKEALHTVRVKKHLIQSENFSCEFSSTMAISGNSLRKRKKLKLLDAIHSIKHKRII